MSLAASAAEAPHVTIPPINDQRWALLNTLSHLGSRCAQRQTAGVVDEGGLALRASLRGLALRAALGGKALSSGPLRVCH
jgi:hypothetical protein